MKKALLLALALIASPPVALEAQDPQLEMRPVEEYLPAMREGDTSAIRYVSRRCAGLFILLAVQMRERAEAGNDDALAAALSYLQRAEQFTLIASALDPLYEQREDEVVERTRVAIQDIAAILTERMNRNLAISGQLWGEDTMILSDMGVCAGISEGFDE
jgi:hypothetical protein